MEWIQTLNRIEMRKEQNLDQLLYSQMTTKSKDIGIVHPETGAGIMAKATGEMVAFADQGIGFRMDPASQTFSIYSPKIKFFCFEHKFYDYQDSTNPALSPEQQKIMELIGGKVDEQI